MDMVVSASAVEEEKGRTSVQTAETLLRLFPMVLCVTALVIMLKDSQTSDFGSISSLDLGAFKYLVYANGICAGYSLLSAFYTAVPRSSTMSRAWTVFFFDQILTYMILAAGTVSAEMLYLAYKGDEAITWSEACGSFSGFCRKATTSVIITFAAVACYAGLSFISSYRLFSRYDPPVSHLSDKGVESAVSQG
ncbi:CASP-like protein 2A1 [Macadamia integrifolia]|uniref:CASP-like protein 2A1 n=1 Tax=Macadamia integrifolia TaxID=60698 RepID=UPI001C4FC10C|nr:CASP-like protein 2A1 [Macadamia integrifolia]